MAAIIGLMLGGRRSVKKNEIPHQLDLISVKRYLTYSKTDKIFFKKKKLKRKEINVESLTRLFLKSQTLVRARQTLCLSTTTRVQHPMT